MATYVGVSVPIDTSNAQYISPGFWWAIAIIAFIGFIMYHVNSEANASYDELKERLAREELEKQAEEQRLEDEKRFEESLRINPEMICPHCQVKGKVTTGKQANGTTIASCANCENAWSF